MSETLFFVSSENDSETLKTIIRKETKDLDLSVVVERELNGSVPNALSEEDFLSRLAKAHLTMHF